MICKRAIYYLILSMLSFFLISCVHTYPAKLMDYKPIEFQEIASDCFFYSIGYDLKYSNSIDVNSRTIGSVDFGYYYVSPDNKKMLIVSNDGKHDISLISVTDCPAKKSTLSPIVIDAPLLYGKIQWASDSRSFYVIKDENNSPDHSYFYAKNEMLIKYDVEKKSIEDIVKIYPIYNFFMGNNSIYYTVPTKDGDLVLKSYFGGKIYDVKVHSNNEFEYFGIGKLDEEPFFNFSIDNYNYSDIIVNKGIQITGRHKLEELTKINMVSNNSMNTLLKLKKGVHFKGWAVGFDLDYSYFLPGDRYFVAYIKAEEFEGYVLIDTKTLKYKELPVGIEIYPNYNTINYKHYFIDGAGVQP